MMAMDPQPSADEILAYIMEFNDRLAFVRAQEAAQARMRGAEPEPLQPLPTGTVVGMSLGTVPSIVPALEGGPFQPTPMEVDDSGGAAVMLGRQPPPQLFPGVAAPYYIQDQPPGPPPGPSPRAAGAPVATSIVSPGRGLLSPRPEEVVHTLPPMPPGQSLFAPPAAASHPPGPAFGAPAPPSLFQTGGSSSSTSPGPYGPAPGQRREPPLLMPGPSHFERMVQEARRTHGVPPPPIAGVAERHPASATGFHTAAGTPQTEQAIPRPPGLPAPGLVAEAVRQASAVAPAMFNIATPAVAATSAAATPRQVEVPVFHVSPRSPRPEDGVPPRPAASRR